ncbi:MAG: chemotaxis protein CheB [Deltaproteobacteria bacterium]|nr:chemotaxis protein CheB [Deltaproteobacteria bacterium]
MLSGPTEAVVIGGSAGAIEALGAILPALSGDAKVPVVVVVHLPSRRASLLVEIFERRCALPVREPEDKQPVSPGIWFAPPDYHLLIERTRTFALSVDDPVRYSRPSIDVLFESAADAFGSGLCAVVLSGANEDGARGAASVKHAGGTVLVQSPESSESAEMPAATLRAARPALVAAPAALGQMLRDLTLGIAPS